MGVAPWASRGLTSDPPLSAFPLPAPFIDDFFADSFSARGARAHTAAAECRHPHARAAPHLSAGQRRNLARVQLSYARVGERLLASSFSARRSAGARPAGGGGPHFYPGGLRARLICAGLARGATLPDARPRARAIYIFIAFALFDAAPAPAPARQPLASQFDNYRAAARRAATTSARALLTCTEPCERAGLHKFEPAAEAR